LQSKDGKVLLKARNVLGCYLAQDLPYIRFCIDVFERALRILFVVKGKFSKEEDEIIRAEVEKNGECDGTWHTLAKILHRVHPFNLKAHYIEQLKGDNYISGAFTLEEDTFILEHLFKGKGDVTVEEINSIKLSSLKPVAEQLHRFFVNVEKHWQSFLKPTLLSHHYGVLHFNWKETFANYIVDKKVDSMQAIDWKDAVRHFPGQTIISLRMFLRNQTYDRMVKDKNLALYEAMRLALDSLKQRQDSEKAKAYREKIVQLYEDIKVS
jgi:hypothetical protein